MINQINGGPFFAPLLSQYCNAAFLERRFYLGQEYCLYIAGTSFVAYSGYAPGSQKFCVEHTSKPQTIAIAEGLIDGGPQP